MKKFNKNMIVFLLAVIFVGFGYNRGFLDQMVDAAKRFAYGVVAGNPDSFSELADWVDSESPKLLAYHDDLMDLDSLKQNLIHTQVVKKGIDLVVKTDSGTLMVTKKQISDEEIAEAVSRVKDLSDAAQENGSAFLYVAAPDKGYEFSVPDNVADYRTSNYDRFTEEMTAQGVPMLDLAAEMKAEGILGEDAYFITDHHWKPETAFWAVNKICQTLDTQYGFAYDSQYTDLENYEITTYEDWFLGAYGKKLGRFFTWEGAEDIDLITPKFATDMVEEQPFKGQVREGSFEDTVLYMYHIDTKNFYENNPYAAYSGGDFRLQIIRNNRNTDGKKIVLIRDSFACAAMPFLSLHASELHVMDVRNFEYFVGEKINVYDYIAEIDPDYVLVLYSGVSTVEGSGGQFDFA